MSTLKGTSSYASGDGFDPRNTIAAFQINFKLSEQNKSMWII